MRRTPALSLPSFTFEHVAVMGNIFFICSYDKPNAVIEKLLFKKSIVKNYDLKIYDPISCIIEEN